MRLHIVFKSYKCVNSNPKTPHPLFTLLQMRLFRLVQTTRSLSGCLWMTNNIQQHITIQKHHSSDSTLKVHILLLCLFSEHVTLHEAEC